MSRWRFPLLACACAILASGSIGVTPAALAAQAPQAPVVRMKLENGLSVLIQEDHRVARVGVAVSYGVGQRDDPPGYRGLAHLIEHAICDASAHVPEGTARRLESVGGDTNARTGSDETTLLSELPARAWETALWIESDRMAYMLAALDERGLARIGKIVTREAQERGPLDPMDEAVGNALYPDDHPYHRLIDGNEEIAEIGLDAVRWFFQRMYGPSNAALAIVGDIDATAVQAAVHKYFDAIRGTPRVTVVRPSARPVELDRARDLRIAPAMNRNWRYERLRVAWATPPHYTAGDAALDLVATLLAERLDERLVHDGSVFRAGVGQLSLALGSRFMLELDMVPGFDPEKALVVVDAELSHLAQPDPAAFERARRHWVLQILGRFDGLVGRAALLASTAVRGLSLSLQDNLERYRALTVEDVARAVRTYLSKDKRVVVHTEFNRFVQRPRELTR